MDKKLFFITGRGRSGTWLLKSVLDAHDDLCVAPEALFIMHLSQKYQHVKTWDKQKLEAFYNDLALEERIIRWWKLDLQVLKKTILSQHPNVTFAHLCKLVYWQYSREQEKSENVYLGDKNPGYTLFLPKLLKTFPEAKFIHMVRDPRDNVRSFKQASFDLNDTAALAERWNYYNKQALKFAKKYPKKCLIIRFEDLLGQSEDTLRKICSFLKVPYTLELLNFYKNPKNVFEWNKKVAEPLDIKAAYKWKTKMEQAELDKVNYICKDLINYFGYELPPLSSSKNKLMLSTALPQIKGRTADFLEEFIFSLPTEVRMKILNFYRKRTKTLNT